MPWNNQSGNNNGGGPWGRGPSGGSGGNPPPDLEELLRRSQDRLKRFMPSGRGLTGAGLVIIALGIAVINIDPPTVLFGMFVAYGLSGYVVYGWRKAKGQPVSVISVSTEEPDERGLHK